MLKSLDECHCSCHNKLLGSGVHCVPCCDTCDYCHKRIDIGCIESHQEECRNKYDPEINSVRLSDLMKASNLLKSAKLDVSSIDEQLVKLVSSIFDQK